MAAPKDHLAVRVLGWALVFAEAVVPAPAPPAAKLPPPLGSMADTHQDSPGCRVEQGEALPEQAV